MKNIGVICMAFIVCSGLLTAQVNTNRRKSILKNDYQSIRIEKFESIVNNDTIRINELKYVRVASAMYIQKGMFDRFGMWNQAIFPKGQQSPILLWINVKLFPDDPTEFIVAANGLENTQTIYASVLVSDAANRDLLSEDSAYRTKLINYFAAMIKANNEKKRDFYDLYWKMRDLKLHEQMMQNQEGK